MSLTDWLRLPGRQANAPFDFIRFPLSNMKNIGIALLIFNSLAVAGCAGGNAIDEAVPQAAFGDIGPPVAPESQQTHQVLIVPAQKPVEASAAAVSTAPTDPLFSGSGQASLTGAYPNINREPVGSAPQMGDAERDALFAKMQALAQAHSRGFVSTSEYRRRLAELRLLGETHSNATIRVIEK